MTNFAQQDDVEMAALLETLNGLRLRALDVLAERVAPQLAVAIERAQGIGQKLAPIVHYGFIPLVIFLGVRSSSPRPSLQDLLTPM